VASASEQRAALRSASDSQLRQQLTRKLDWMQMDSAQRRAFLDSLNSPPAAAR
jgi:hypothetical protein